MLSAQDYFKINDEWLAEQPTEVQQKYERKYRQGRRTRAPRTTPAGTCDTPLQPQFQDATATNFELGGRAMLALHRISADRCEHYDTWVSVGMALSELGRVGFVLWDEWSKKSAKYSPSACAEKWPTFTPGDGLTLGSLFAWADEDSPVQTPTDGCRPDCPNRSRVAAHQSTIRQLEQEITSLQERNRFVTQAQGAKGVKSASLRDTVVELKKELDRVPVEERTQDAFVPVRPAYMGACANSSASTVNRHLKRLEDQGIIERKVETIYVPDEDKWTAQTYVRPRVDLTDPSVLVVPSEHGGSRKVRCIKPDCRSTNIVDKVERICLDCKTPQGEVKYIPVNEVEDLSDEMTYQAAITAESSAIEETSERGNASCVPNSNEPSTTDEMDSTQETHLAFAPSSVPSAVEDASDLVSAIRAADAYSPPDEQGRFAFKSALSWINRQQPIKAEAYLDRIGEPRARAIVAHLVART